MPDYILEHYQYPYDNILNEIEEFQKSVIASNSFNKKYFENYDFESKKSIKYLAGGVLKNGGINLLKRDSKIVGISSYYHWNGFTVGAVRYLKLPQEAHEDFPLIIHSIPFQIEMAKKQGSGAFCIAVNADHEKMLNFFLNLHKVILSKKKESAQKRAAMEIISRFKHFGRQVNFNYCQQHLFYIDLRESFNPDELLIFNNSSSIK